MNNDMNTVRVLGVVTLYYPNKENVTKNILAYLPYIDKLVVWNNTDNENDLERKVIGGLSSYKDKILWKENRENLGLAKAYNFTIDYAKENNYNLLLLMDQDSNWVDFPMYIEKVKNKYLLGDVCVYTPNISGYDSQEMDEIDKELFINSGTILPLKIIEKVGPQDETFKIDALDVDYSLRVRREGFKIKSFPQCILNHSFGNIIKSKIFRIKSPNYNAFRTYSIVFSHIVLIRKDYNDLNVKDIWTIFKEHILYKFIRIVIMEPDKLNKLKMLYRGIYDGLSYNLKNNTN